MSLSLTLLLLFIPPLLFLPRALPPLHIDVTLMYVLYDSRV